MIFFVVANLLNESNLNRHAEVAALTKAKQTQERIQRIERLKTGTLLPVTERKLINCLSEYGRFADGTLDSLCYEIIVPVATNETFNSIF